jgi:hypothetical protein
MLYAAAAAGDKSSKMLRRSGPRSFIRTIAFQPCSRLVTSMIVPKGRLRCGAAVRRSRSSFVAGSEMAEKLCA